MDPLRDDGVEVASRIELAFWGLMASTWLKEALASVLGLMLILFGWLGMYVEWDVGSVCHEEIGMLYSLVGFNLEHPSSGVLCRVDGELQQ